MNAMVKYRADIDGLRALAVLAVVFFHAGFPYVEGGYVGVDIFFVISGYLITRIIAGEIAEGRFSLARFYERRIRRIFPALFTVLAATWCVSLYLLTPLDFKEFSASVIAAGLSVSNIYFWQTMDYFAGPADSKPLLHTWSLGVEEQFYILFPFVLLAAFRWFRHYVLWVVVLGGVASFALSALLSERLGSAAFYLLPFRGWELMIGSVLALTPPEKLPQSRWLREAMAVGGLGMIAFAVLSFSEDTVFPGSAAAVPALGAGLLIASRGARVNMLLAWRPLVGIGLISYSLYLWHWPIMVYTKYYALSALDMWDSTAMVAASIAFAYASWRWVEQPFRHSGTASRMRVLYAGIAAMALASLIAASGILTQGFPQRYPLEVRDYAQRYTVENYYTLYDRGGCFLDTNSGQQVEDYNIATCADYSNDESNRIRVLIYGDSYAAHLYSGLQGQNGLAVKQFTATSCRPIKTNIPRCEEVRRYFLGTVLPASNADVIVISANWINYYDKLGKAEFQKRLQQSVNDLRAEGKRLVLVGQSPKFVSRIPHTLMVHGLQGQSEVKLRIINMQNMNDAVKAVAAATNSAYFDPLNYACDADMCTAVKDGAPLHWDAGHMTAEGSRFYAEPLAEEILSLFP